MSTSSPSPHPSSALAQWLAAHSDEEVYGRPGPTPIIDEDLPSVVIDFDGTLHHYFDAVRLHPKCPPIPHTEFEDYYSFRDMIGAELLYEIASDETALDRMIEVGLYPGTVEALHELSQVANIIVMSHRGLHHGPRVSQALAHYEVPHMCFLVGSVDKVAFCKEYGLAVLVDDKPSTLIQAHEQGIKTATILQPYNRKLVKELGIPAADTWADLLPRVISQLADV